MKMEFNPFNKDYDQLHEKDLSVLKSVSEGWYIEYWTRPFPLRRSIPKDSENSPNTFMNIELINKIKTNNTHE